MSNGMGIELKLSDEQMREALSAALLAQMTDDARADVIKQAIAHLTKPSTPTNYSSDRRSPIQKAFDLAIEQFCHQWARELITSTPEIKEAFNATISKVAADVMRDSPSFQAKVTAALNRCRGGRT